MLILADGWYIGKNKLISSYINLYPLSFLHFYLVLKFVIRRLISSMLHTLPQEGTQHLTPVQTFQSTGTTVHAYNTWVLATVCHIDTLYGKVVDILLFSKNLCKEEMSPTVEVSCCFYFRFIFAIRNLYKTAYRTTKVPDLQLVNLQFY